MKDSSTAKDSSNSTSKESSGLSKETGAKRGPKRKENRDKEHKTRQESLEVPPKPDDEDLANDSDSSEDRPILQAVAEAQHQAKKRKVEVLSKESGKIGITITTSTNNNISSSDAKKHDTCKSSDVQSDLNKNSVEPVAPATPFNGKRVGQEADVPPVDTNGKLYT